jgi:hypothetical protein
MKLLTDRRLIGLGCLEKEIHRGDVSNFGKVAAIWQGMEGTDLKIDAQWRPGFEASVHLSPWSGSGLFLHQQCSGTARYLSPLSAIAALDMNR